MKMYDDQVIVVTGGSGFIGSCLLRHLNDNGMKNLVVVDELGHSEKWKNLVGKDIVDVISKHQIFQWLEGRESLVEAFVHLGACTSTVETDASYLLENNFNFSKRLAEYAFRNDQRFIYASSAATYGDGTLGFSDDESQLTKLRPLNMYGYSKQAFDMWLKNEGLLDRCVGLKFFNVFGPNEEHKGRMASAVVHFMKTIHKDGTIRLFKSSEPKRFADGGQQRDFIYVKDVVRMIQAFLENDATGIYNIGTGLPGTWNELADAVFTALRLKPKIEYIDMPQDLVGKYQNFTCADMTKTRKVLGEVANSTPLKPAVIDYVQNYLEPGLLW